MSPASSIWATWWARCCRPTSSPAICRGARLRDAGDLRHRRAWRAGRAGGAGGRARRSPTTAAKWHAVQKELGDALRPVLGPFRPLVLAAEPRADAAFRARSCGRTASSKCARPSRSIRTTDKRFLPDRYVIGTCPHCGYDRARGDQCENCTRVLDPVDLINPRSAVSGVDGHRDPRLHASVPEAVAVRRQAARLDRRATRPTGRCWSPPSPTNGWTRGCRIAASPATWNGACRCRTTSRDGTAEGQGVLRLVRRAHRIYRRHQGMGRQERQGRCLERLVVWRRRRRTSPIWNSWARTTCRSTRWAFPSPSWASGEPWKLVDRLKGFNWLNYDGGKFSTSQQARRLHGRGAGDRCRPITGAIT